MPSILTNLVALLLFLLFAVLPAYYTNKYLLQLIRPTASVLRFLAYIVIILAAAAVYTTIVVVVLIKFVFQP